MRCLSFVAAMTLVWLVDSGPAYPQNPADSAEVLRGLRTFERELDLCFERLARNAESLDAVELSRETERFRARLEFLQAELQRLDPVDFAPLVGKLAALGNRWSDLGVIAKGGAAPAAVQRLRPAGGHSARMRGAAPPANDDCTSAITIGFGSIAGDTSLATNDGEAACGSSLFSPDVWFKLVAPVSGRIFADTLGSSFDTVVSVHSACPGTIGNALACNDDAFGSASSAGFNANAGAEYWIRVAGFGGARGAFVLNVGTGGEISGKVTDAGTGDPLSGARIDLWREDGSYFASTVAAADGTYSLGGLPPGLYFVSTRNGQGFIDELYDDLPCPGGAWFFGGCDPVSGTLVQVDNDAATVGIDFRLDRGSTITGTVRDASTGTGVAGVRVEVWDSADRLVRSIVTGAIGDYMAEGLTAGTYFVSTESSFLEDQLYDGIPCPGGASGGCVPTTGTPIVLGVAATVSGIDFTLDRRGSVSGTVTDAVTGDPIPSIHVEIRTAGGSYAGADYTDGSGAYAVAGLASGTYFAIAESFDEYSDELYDELPCPGGAPYGCDATTGTPIEVALNTTVEGIDFTLDRLGIIAGTVIQASTGDPIPSMYVEIWKDGGSFETRGFTDSTGVYSVNGLEAGTYYARTQSIGVVNELFDDLPCPSGCDPTAGTPIPVSLNATTSGIDFALVLKGAVAGTVTDADSGLPISSGRVEIWDASGSFAGSDYLDAAGGYVVTDLDAGTHYASTKLYSGGFLDELYDGNPCLGGAPYGCNPITGTPIAVSLDATASGIDFALGQGGTIAGTVTDAATGDPLTSGLVEVYDASGSHVGVGHLGSGGDYTVSGLATGSYFARSSLYRSHQNELYDDIPCPFGGCDVTTGAPIAVTVGTTTSGVDFALRRLGAISGTVTDALTGDPITRGYVEIWNSTGGYVDSDFLDASGSYRVDGLGAGAYYARTDLFFNGTHLDELYDDLPCAAGCDVTSGTPIAVALAATTSGIDFALDRAGAISGVIRDARTGEPIRDASVTAQAAGGSYRSDSTDASGFYTVTGLAAGTYFVTASSYQYLDELYDDLPCEDGCDPTQGAPVQVALNATTRHVNFALDRLGAVSGTVTQAVSGEPLSDILVKVWDAAGSYVDGTWTDDSGRYLFPRVPPGTYYASTENHDGFLDELYDDLPCVNGAPAGCEPDKGAPIVVALGTTTGGIDFALLSLDTGFAGTVTAAETGEPEARVIIDLWSSSGEHLGSVASSAAGTYFASLAPGSYFASTDNGSGLVDMVYDGRVCPGPAFAGLCDVMAGSPIVVPDSGLLGQPEVTAGIDFALGPGELFQDGFESGDFAGWSSALGFD